MPSVNLSPLFNGQTVFGSTSLPLASGMIYTYQAGSSTPWATYTSSNGTVANTNPIILGTDAKLPNELWLQAGFSYKFVVKDSDDVLVATYDDIAGILTQIPTTSPAVPSGCILVWSGAVGAIPSGFLICDGTNGTPDLRDRFVIGAGLSYSVGQTGGSADAIVVSHTHPYSGTTGGQSADHSHSGTTGGQSVSHDHGPGVGGAFIVAGVGVGGFVGGGDAGNVAKTSPQNTDHSHNFSTGGVSNGHTHDISGTTNSAGQSGTGANLPPYYALAFIMKS
jgi:hypothetical protein